MLSFRSFAGLYRQIITSCLVCILVVIAGCSSPAPKPSETKTTPVVSEKAKPTTKKYQRSKPVTYSTGQQIALLAESMIGSPYKYGGSSPKGFDCSGLVYYTHQQLNISVPRTTRQQAAHTKGKPLSSAQPGDILFFRIYGDRISHVGIYAGKNQFIHAPKSGKKVSYANVNDPFWRDRLVKVGSLH